MYDIRSKLLPYHSGINYKRNYIALYENHVLDYGTITISLSVSEDPVQFELVDTEKSCHGPGGGGGDVSLGPVHHPCQ